MTQSKTYLPYFTGVGFAVIFGFSFMFSKVALNFATAFQLVGLRFLLAIVALLLLKVVKLIKINLKPKDFIAVLPLAVFQPVLYFLGETFGIQFTSASLSGIFMALIPVVTAGLSYFMLGERLNIKQIMFVALSLAGVIIISYMTLIDAPKQLTMGVLFLLLAVVSAAIYTVLTRKLTKKYSPIEITFVMMVVGAVVFNIAGVTDSVIKGYRYFAPFASSQFVWSVLFLGLVSSIGAFFLMVYTGSKVPASQNALFVNLVTVVAIIAGAVFLNEKIYTYQIIGSVLIILGVWGANFFASRIKG